ncbi:D-alanyl-D-alanine dipeptidase [Thalassoglobus neptunius]|uniref:D-alanyl-D-alanine dipeptidase n=1 Tax=Thalassoglobus neptunius TaxID=1938619 RepID=A0A5C5X5S4_9PLAN|nr:serine hydrolase [Thalassoglobus neptunius]TWT58274.1 D-alanyl-D-alanine dipeptidase [Thalassoglobus neptunius]
MNYTRTCWSVGVALLASALLAGGAHFLGDKAFLFAQDKAIAEGDATGSETLHENAVQKLEAAISYEMEQKNLPGLSIALVNRNGVLWSSGFGSKDLKGETPCDSETIYRLGSVSKLFTDLAVMKLADEGKLDIDAPVTDILPSFQPENPTDKPITLRMLMSHRSGIVREPPVGSYYDASEPALEETVASLNETKLVYPPETKTKYSNAGITVVGLALQEVLGKPYPECLRDELLNPLEMNQSGFEVTDSMKPDVAQGRLQTFERIQFPAPTFSLGIDPAGGLRASMVDLAKFVQCILNDGVYHGKRIISAKLLEEMMAEQVDESGEPQQFGIGFDISRLDDNKKVGHAGAVYGFSTQLSALPERGLGVVASCSLDNTNGVVDRLADYALRLVIAAQNGSTLPEYQTTVPVPTERVPDIIGLYQEVDGDGWSRINEIDGKVTVSYGPVHFIVRASADDGNLVVDDVFGFGLPVNFQSHDDLTIGDEKFRRVPDTCPEDAPEKWKDLIGEYGEEHSPVYIREVNGQLHALVEYLFDYPLSELGTDRFTYNEHAMSGGEGVEFVRDSDGKVTAVVSSGVVFPRREVGTEKGETFKITPIRPVEELRVEALQASPPEESGNFRETDLVEVVELDDSVQLDIRYATDNNFMGAVFYKQPRAYMQRPAAEALVRVQKRLKEEGLGLQIFDAYRPWYVTKMFWEATPGKLKDFVANPQYGSRHNRGCAVDLTLVDIASGVEVPMVAGYDEFSSRSYPEYPGGTSRQRWFRDHLRRAMEREGFTVYEFEWWHFDYRDWKKYRIGNQTFEEMTGQ